MWSFGLPAEERKIICGLKEDYGGLNYSYKLSDTTFKRGKPEYPSPECGWTLMTWFSGTEQGRHNCVWLPWQGHKRHCTFPIVLSRITCSGGSQPPHQEDTGRPEWVCGKERGLISTALWVRFPGSRSYSPHLDWHLMRNPSQTELPTLARLLPNSQLSDTLWDNNWWWF